MTTIDPIDYTDEQLVAMAANVTAFLERAPFEEYSISYLRTLAIGNARGQLPLIAALRQRTQERDRARADVHEIGEINGRFFRDAENAERQRDEAVALLREAGEVIGWHPCIICDGDGAHMRSDCLGARIDRLLRLADKPGSRDREEP